MWRVKRDEANRIRYLPLSGPHPRNAAQPALADDAFDLHAGGPQQPESEAEEGSSGDSVGGNSATSQDGGLPGGLRRIQDDILLAQAWSLSGDESEHNEPEEEQHVVPAAPLPPLRAHRTGRF